VAARHPKECATNLAAVFLDDETEWLEQGGLGKRMTWPYPKHVHGRIVRELSEQGAKAIAFDVLLGGARPDDDEPLMIPEKPGVKLLIGSGKFFSQQLRAASNVVLAANEEVVPIPAYRTNAWALGGIGAIPDADGVLRRAKPFVTDAIEGRRWHLGILLAARALNLDLNKTVILPDRIVLTGPNATSRTIPLDAEGNFMIDWSLSWKDPRILHLSFGKVLALDKSRQEGRYTDYLNDLAGWRGAGKTNLVGENPFKDKLVVIGSIMEGNNLTDYGATPIYKRTFLVSEYWNVANSLITGTFIQQSPLPLRLALIFLVGGISGWLTWRLRTLAASFWVAMLAVAFVGSSVILYVQNRYWLPLVLPIIALLLVHFSLISYQVIFEQKEKRKVKSIFGKMVSPNIVNEMLAAEELHLGGARRKVTVLFSDVRGFTELTDSNQANAEDYVKAHHLTGAAKEAYFDNRAREVLQHVNLYLGIIADAVKKHEGTLDKYIGDCVMAFWGAPTPNERHAVCCVRAIIDAQRAIYALNVERAAENKRREQENLKRAQDGLEPMLPLLSLGSGINTGVVTVGLMGSDSHIVNYTVFGREVNLASRLEGVSGRGRIIIGESTFEEIQRDDPELAATCVALAPVTVKGIRNPVRIYEVPWKQAAPTAVAAPAMALTPVPPEKS